MQTWNDSYAKIERARKLGLWENGSPKRRPARNRKTSCARRRTERAF
ncbi:hypothetical protein M5E88_15210 [Akkermansia muciniphila]|nr:hypothetical protein M5E88_15210 [Akkermansia muciniphila]